MTKKILIVDDSEAIRQQVNFTLAKGGYEIIEAEDGRDAMEKMRSNDDISLIISDVNMPVMTGLEMLEAMKAEGSFPSVPIIMLTTVGITALIGRAKKAGANGWLVKPFNPDHLVAAAERLTS
ncbi:MAG: response regulator [Bdellovibrionota bacterium]|nr:MAG: response regulator [Pseudomonadota bacterium]